MLSIFNSNLTTNTKWQMSLLLCDDVFVYLYTLEIQRSRLPWVEFRRSCPRISIWGGWNHGRPNLYCQLGRQKLEGDDWLVRRWFEILDAPAQRFRPGAGWRVFLIVPNSKQVRSLKNLLTKRNPLYFIRYLFFIQCINSFLIILIILFHTSFKSNIIYLWRIAFLQQGHSVRQQFAIGEHIPYTPKFSGENWEVRWRRQASLSCLILFLYSSLKRTKCWSRCECTSALEE